MNPIHAEHEGVPGISMGALTLSCPVFVTDNAMVGSESMKLTQDFYDPAT